MTSEIVNKISSHILKERDSFDESDVYYLMILIRKLLEHDKRLTENNKSIKFYSDWTLHIKKDRITSVVKSAINELYVEAKKLIVKTPLVDGKTIASFLYFDKLKIDIDSVFKEFNIPQIDSDNWSMISSVLTTILVNQPIINPTEQVLQFKFVPAAANCATGVLFFKEDINGYDHFKFSNAY